MNKANLHLVTRLGNDGFSEIYDLQLCLNSQIDENFKWFILLRPSAHAKIKDLISNLKLTPNLWAKTIIVKTDTDNRSKLLNQALKRIKDGYLVVFDDDDLPLSNYVKVIRNTIRMAKGTPIIRTEVVEIGTIRLKINNTFFQVSMTKAYFNWPTTFDRLAHVAMNRTPCMAVSFPVEIMKKYKLNWDEKLSVAEDWDILMRASEFIPVVSVKAPTSIYRKAGSSYRSQKTVSLKSWKLSESLVREKIDKQNFILSGRDISMLQANQFQLQKKIIPFHVKRLIQLATFLQPKLIQYPKIYSFGRYSYRMLKKLLRLDKYA
jgi:hypothetical protein